MGKAIGYYGWALAIDRDIGDRRGEGGDLCNLGLAYRKLGELAKARALLEQALAIGREIEDPQIIRIASQALQELGT